ncbi:hypothetical protein [Nocardioides sp. cx-173]|uniref:hypothetical protein n=1 Tax=Nocardioides sp. cx-173 TaxID=2898796 RepID=UPI001E6441DB|nr:hypothetical protein [Nocardioides sp. cx-173]MCD4523893.1 hypothetical protein [Nocardioides sp. cx-173]UGB41788.1 hypothetical protein LQ940_20865 [Nocardioides sp. cx-173]
MEAALLAVHVLGGILFVGPVAIASSLFPRYAPVSTVGATAGATVRDAGRSLAVAQALHRITRVYGVIGILVPLVGIALSFVQGRFGEVWISVAMVLTAVAGGVLAFRIVPAQAAALSDPLDRRQLARIGMLAGIFNLLWAAVVILMVVRPGSDYVS